MQRLSGPQCYLSSFQLFKQKRWSCGRFNRFLPLVVKGPFCVEVLSSFYGRFFVEEGQFINSTSSLHLCRHFFYWLTPPRFGALNRESESCGSKPVYRKLFPRGPHSSKNTFFDIPANALRLPLCPIRALGIPKFSLRIFYEG